MANQPAKMIEVILIDPYKRELRKARMARDLKTWYQVLHCDCVDAQRLMRDGDFQVDIWFDDEFLCNEPVPPWFEICGNRYAGYAFIANSNAEGDTISVSKTGMKMSNENLAQMLDLRFEPYENRLGPDAYMDLRIRTPELEMPGRFKFMDICPDCGKVHS